MDPVLNEKIEILIVGTYPGAKSRELNQYYSDSRNQFWKLMGEILDINLIDMDYKTKTETLLNHNIGLWDTIQDCDTFGSLDKNIRDPVFNDFSQFTNVRKIVCNGKKAGKFIGECQQPANVEVLVVPSSSAAKAMKFEEKVREWEEKITVSIE